MLDGDAMNYYELDFIYPMKEAVPYRDFEDKGN
jgi:hypothetical protein